MNPARNILLFSVLAGAALVALLAWPSFKSRLSQDAAGRDAAEPLVLFCAAGIKPAVEPIVREYQERYGRVVQVQYGGSGTLLANLKLAAVGDLFLAADTSYMNHARSNGIVAEVLEIARLTPVVAVTKGNPKGIHSLADLFKSDIRIALANPEAAAVGNLVQKHLSAAGLWEPLVQNARTLKPTVNDLANDLKLGTIDATIIWDATVRTYPEIEMVLVPELAKAQSAVAIGVLNSSARPSTALHFARYIAASDRGLPIFAEHGFTPIAGDAWEERPQVTLYSGGVNRTAIEQTLREFEEREGIEILRVYNGCGILTAQIKSGQRPDAYFSCDTSFMETVSHWFHPSTNLAQADIIIAVPKGNPENIRGIGDLTRPNLKLGVAHEHQSALGALTARLLTQHGLWTNILKNVVVQTPTADLLVNQLRTGALDAAIVYEVNTRAASAFIDTLPLQLPGAIATQPYAVGLDSPHQHLMNRLLETLRAQRSRERFVSSGFNWLAQDTK